LKFAAFVGELTPLSVPPLRLLDLPKTDLLSTGSINAPSTTSMRSSLLSDSLRAPQRSKIRVAWVLTKGSASVVFALIAAGDAGA
jgi:hypothetical protein